VVVEVLVLFVCCSQEGALGEEKSLEDETVDGVRLLLRAADEEEEEEEVVVARVLVKKGCCCCTEGVDEGW